MLNFKNITAAVASAWDGSFGETLAVVTPGRRIDGETLAEWVDLDVETVTGRPNRPASAFDGVTVTANVFVRDATNAYRARQLAGLFVDAFDGALFSVVDVEASSRPTVGYVRFGEATLRDGTRAAAVGEGLSVVTLTWRATAQPLGNH